MGGANEAGRFGLVTGGAYKIIRRVSFARPPASRFCFFAKRALGGHSFARRLSGQHVQRITKMMVKLPLLM
jgi:hypothetical protein